MKPKQPSNACLYHNTLILIKIQVHSDFVSAATRGAIAVIDGNVMAINPGEDPKMQMFIWNNIFFSLGFDVRDHYKDLGGDAAAFVAPRNDLQGVKGNGRNKM